MDELGYVPLPSYHESHRLLLLDNDLGTEITIRPTPNFFALSFGYFNGNGVFALNTNNAKAYTARMVFEVPIDSVTLTLGVAGYSAIQSSSGSVNYRANWVANPFISVDWEQNVFGLEGFSGHFTDSTRSASPLGVAAFVNWALVSRLRGFARVEAVEDSPSGGRYFFHWQVGPELGLHETLRVFAYYDMTKQGTVEQSSFQVRTRFCF